jgi:hypothetical protein
VPGSVVGHTATGWSVRNHAGVVVASGSLTSTDEYIDIDDSLLEQGNGNGPCGSYYLRLTGADALDGDYVTSRGDVIFQRVPEHTGKFPELPVHPDQGGGSWNEAVRSLCGMGPVRWELGNGQNTAATILTRATRMDTYWMSLDPGGRYPRHNIGHIVWGMTEPGTLVVNNTPAEVTAIVNTLKTKVKVWEGLNEPSGDGGYAGWPSAVQDYINREGIPFYNAVKAADPTTSIVLGPNLVSYLDNAIGMQWFEEWLALGGADYVDAISIHTYNHSRGDIWLSKSVLNDIKAAMAAASVDKPIWQTEQGEASTFGGALIPRFGARFDQLRRFMQELGGTPIERDSRWYDLEHGFPAVPFQWLDDDGGTCAFGTLSRVMVAETWNKPLASVLDFGSAGDIYAGGYWEDTAGAGVVGIVAQSPNLPSVRLTVTGATVVTYVDEWGNETALAATAGKVTVPVSDHPVWVRVPVGVTAELVAADWAWGTNKALTATVTTTTSSSTNLTRVNDGIRQNSYYDGTNLPGATAHSQFNANATTTLPDTITFTWASAQTGNKVVIDSSPVQQTFVSIPLAFTIELELAPGVWTEVYSYTAPNPSAKTQDFRSEAWESTTETWWDDSTSVHVIDLDQSYTFTAMRYVVTNVSFGAHPSQAFSQVMWGADSWKSISLREVEVFDAAAAAAAKRTVLLLSSG